MHGGGGGNKVDLKKKKEAAAAPLKGKNSQSHVFLPSVCAERKMSFSLLDFLNAPTLMTLFASLSGRQECTHREGGMSA